jgi:3-dehydroquinate synthase
MNTETLAPSATHPDEPRDTITVSLGDRSYDIVVGVGWFDRCGQVFRDRGFIAEGVMVFTSPHIGDLYFNRLEKSLRSAGFQKICRHDIPDGEQNKNLEQFGKCCEAIVTNFPQSESEPLVINLGGGVVGDIGGFVAATFLRSGVPYIQIPTTLLGCVDCGVGGKVGVNSEVVKNIIGLFYQPSLVFADLELLHTLPVREIRSGVAEVIKYGVVCDENLFAYLEQNIERLIALDEGVLGHIVSECYRIKARIVEEDEEDRKGKRNVLNYGHTIGHALEMAAHFKFTHGEAISVGMVAANRIAVRLGVMEEQCSERVSSLIRKAGLPVSSGSVDVSFDQLISSMKHDKKFTDGRNLFVLPTRIGAWKIERDVDMAIVIEASRSVVG